jgi:hypothetical protein
MRHRFFIYCTLCLMLASPPAAANTGSAVGGATVEKGKTALEYRLAGALDDENAGQDDRIRTRVHLDHAFTDLYAARLVLVMDRRKGDGFEASGLSLQNRFHIIKRADHGWDGGLRLNYTFADGDKKPDDLSLRFYQEFPLAGFDVRFNQIFGHEIGEDSGKGIRVEWRSQITRKIGGGGTALGLDFFHDFGNLADQAGYRAQQHALGPVVKAKFGGGYGLEAGYRVGVSAAAPDHSATFIFTRSW